MVMTIVLLIGMIVVKTNPSLSKSIKEIVYEKNFNLIQNKKLYKKYFGSILDNKSNIESVSFEKLDYKKDEKYQEGVNLLVSTNYPVPVLESGVITYIKDNTLVIDQVNGIETYYSNINSDLKLYDYVEKGSILGLVKDNKLYLKFKKDGKYLNYKEYI